MKYYHLTFFQLITEPANLHWLDESYFNSYRQNLEDVFKAPGVSYNMRR